MPLRLQGTKKGETWSVDGGGHRYQRWWGEEHFGNGWVRRFGNSTTGAHAARRSFCTHLRSRCGGAFIGYCSGQGPPAWDQDCPDVTRLC